MNPTIEELIQQRIEVAKSEAVEQFIRRGRGLPMHRPAGAPAPNGVSKPRGRRRAKARKAPGAMHCKKCGKTGHNSRTCGREAKE